MLLHKQIYRGSCLFCRGQWEGMWVPSSLLPYFGATELSTPALEEATAKLNQRPDRFLWISWTWNHHLNPFLHGQICLRFASLKANCPVSLWSYIQLVSLDPQQPTCCKGHNTRKRESNVCQCLCCLDHCSCSRKILKQRKHRDYFSQGPEGLWMPSKLKAMEIICPPFQKGLKCCWKCSFFFSDLERP